MSLLYTENFRPSSVGPRRSVLQWDRPTLVAQGSPTRSTDEPDHRSGGGMWAHYPSVNQQPFLLMEIWINPSLAQIPLVYHSLCPSNHYTIINHQPVIPFFVPDNLKFDFHLKNMVQPCWQYLFSHGQISGSGSVGPCGSHTKETDPLWSTMDFLAGHRSRSGIRWGISTNSQVYRWRNWKFNSGLDFLHCFKAKSPSNFHTSV